MRYSLVESHREQHMHAGRFAGALTGCSPKLEDQPLWRNADSIVLPTLGMIVPGWFLVVPTAHSLNLAGQRQAVIDSFPALIETILQSAEPERRDFVVFEHGAAESGSPIGCGADHAHLHVLTGRPAFLDAVWEAMTQELSAIPDARSLGALYDSVAPDTGYYLAWREGTRLLEQPAKQVTSQRLRRLVAEVAGRPDAWDYRAAPFHDNISRTVETFAAGRSVAA